MPALYSPLLSALIDAFHPLFLLVMGICLVIVAWRLALTASGWDARLIVLGSLLLGLGYSVLLPLHESGLIAALRPLEHSREITSLAFGWRTLEMAVMNGGWLLFGLGMARHAKAWGTPTDASATPVQTIR